MRAEDVVEEFLRDHEAADANRDRQDRVWVSAKRESLVRLLDAGVEVLSATGHLLAVAEEVLKEQRDRLSAPPADETEDVRARDRERRKRIDLTY